jgi:hypothetical protein
MDSGGLMKNSQELSIIYIMSRVIQIPHIVTYFLKINSDVVLLSTHFPRSRFPVDLRIRTLKALLYS